MENYDSEEVYPHVYNGLRKYLGRVSLPFRYVEAPLEDNLARYELRDTYAAIPRLIGWVDCLNTKTDNEGYKIATYYLTAYGRRLYSACYKEESRLRS